MDSIFYVDLVISNFIKRALGRIISF